MLQERLRTRSDLQLRSIGLTPESDHPGWDRPRHLGRFDHLELSIPTQDLKPILNILFIDSLPPQPFLRLLFLLVPTSLNPAPACPAFRAPYRETADQEGGAGGYLGVVLANYKYRCIYNHTKSNGMAVAKTHDPKLVE